MRLSVILELLLIFLLIAFAAYGRVIEPTTNGRAIVGKKAAGTKESAVTSLKQATDNVNKYCVCNENICNCCRDFHIPLVKLSGPGCASLQYLQDDKLAMQLSIGDNILSSNVVNGKNPKPVCVALPGGFSKFCGKIYSIKREADKNFKACLGLELRSSSELEASLRVSCFRFGPDGLKLRPAEPLPASLSAPASSSDDDYDFFGLDDDDEDDDDDDDEEEDEDDQKVSADSNSVAGSAASGQQEIAQDPEDQEDEEDDDILGLGALFDIFAGDDDETKKKKKVTTPTPLPPSFAIPILSLTTTAAPGSQEILLNKKPTAASTSVEASSTVLSDDLSILNSAETPTQAIGNDEMSKTTLATEKESYISTEKIISEDATTIANIGLDEKVIVTPAKTSKVTGIKVAGIKVADKTKLKKVVVVIPSKKKVNATPQSVNEIVSNTLKPQEEEATTATNDDGDDDSYEYDSQSDEIEDSNEEKPETVTNIDDEDKKQVSNDKDDDEDEDDEEADEDEEEEDETAEAVVDDDDDEEEEEEAVLSALMDDENKDSTEKSTKNKKKNDKSDADKASKEDGDYGDLAELLARKHPHSRVIGNNGNLRTVSRQSKVMRL